MYLLGPSSRSSSSSSSSSSVISLVVTLLMFVNDFQFFLIKLSQSMSRTVNIEYTDRIERTQLPKNRKSYAFYRFNLLLT